MNEDDSIAVFIDESGGIIESLIKSRKHLIGNVLLKKLDLVIEAELDVALMSAEKAKSEILKKQKKDKDNVLRPIK